MTPDIDSLFKENINAAIAIPSITQFMNASSSEEIDALDASASVTYKPRNFIPIPPFLVEIVYNKIKKSNGNARSVLLEY